MTVDIGVLLDERAMYRTLYKLAELMDECDWGQLSEVFADDATGDFGEGPMDRAGIEASYRRYLGACGPTQHLLGNVVIDVDGDRASSRCYVRDVHQGKPPSSHLTFYSPGQYLDQWIRTAEGWRISHRTKRNLMQIGSMEVFAG